MTISRGAVTILEDIKCQEEKNMLIFKIKDVDDMGKSRMRELLVNSSLVTSSEGRYEAHVLLVQF